MLNTFFLGKTVIFFDFRNMLVIIFLSCQKLNEYAQFAICNCYLFLFSLIKSILFILI